MSVTVDYILKLNLLKNAELVAGKNGLSREVMRVNFTDSPIDISNPGYNLVSTGDLYIHSFYGDDNNDEQVYNLIKFYIETGSSCCIGVKYNFTSLPDKVLKLANQEKYPIIMIDDEIAYGQLIKDISELILTEQLDIYSENKLNQLLYDSLNEKECTDLIQYLIPEMPKQFYCLYVTFPDLSPVRFKLLKDDLLLNFKVYFLRYQRGGFIIFDVSKNYSVSITLDNLSQLFKSYDKTFWIGVSSRCNRVDNSPLCFKEALSAHEISKVTKNIISYYDGISLYSLLLQLRGQNVLNIFVNETLGPLKKYQERHSIDLINTIRVYFETNGNYNETAKLLNTHGNTVRFRIAKAKSLLDLEFEPYAFIEKVSLALKAEQLL